MDSMRSLNTSLPRSYPRRHPPADLHQAFKAAALSVAQLYKTAAADEDHARAEGYQDAIEEILAFLDQENLGLGDGEGWKVRQWATERLSPEAYRSGEEDADELRQQSKELLKSPTQPSPRDSGLHDNNHPRSSSAPALESPEQHPPQQPQVEQQTSTRPEIFQFNSTLPPDDSTMANHDRASDRISNISNPRRLRNRSHASGLREGTSAVALAALGLGAGAKRKQPSNDIFDFSMLESFKDSNNGGGKRGRFI